jgi:uncharacterized protein
VWDEPASACLSSRIPYHSEVTSEKLAMIERAEDALIALGFRVCRVRHHGEVARVEVAREDLPRALGVRHARRSFGVTGRRVRVRPIGPKGCAAIA